MAWQKNGIPDTLTSTGPDVEITDLSAVKFNQVMIHVFPDGADTIESGLRFNDNSNSVYTTRHSKNGLDTRQVFTSNPRVVLGISRRNQDLFVVGGFVSILGEEKLAIVESFAAGAAGAGNAPELRNESFGKFIPSPDAEITQVKGFDTDDGTHDYAIDSNISALGTD